MREFIRFMLGRYWNDPDAKDVGGREFLVICWVMTFVSTLAAGGIVYEIACHLLC
jgi:hypothetical protein